ncbi:BA75_00707T0 [Komagataella pastoris]|uniref:BA75_00707T0 n=1 Tax=Komagataella pastoris TaxID=4922 RepID=A0A1B2J8Z4_PICPA|nr:BA75_00707T0 [Komagataella pastoris]
MSSLIPKGFHQVPRCKAFTVLLILVPIFASLFDLKYVFILSYDPFISQWRQYWRILIYQLSFQNESEVMIGVALIHFAIKHLERIYGSNKFLGVVVASYLYNMAATALLMELAYHLLGLDIYVSAGPFGIITSLIYFYFQSTPSAYKFQINLKVNESRPNSKIVLTDQFFIKILILQLAIFNIIPCATGYLIGILLHRDILPGKGLCLRLSMPKFKRGPTRSTEEIDRLLAGSNNEEEDDDEHEDLQDQNDDSDEPGRAETPVRPLGTQILNTFRA